VNAAELIARTDIPAPQFAVDGLVPLGGVTVLAGPEKSGKSWFLAELLMAVADGRPVCGHWSVPLAGDALYISNEDTDGSLRDRLMQLYGARGTAPSERLEVATEWPEADEGGIEQLDEWLSDFPGCRVVAIDIMRKFLPLGTPYSHHVDARKIDRMSTLADRHEIGLVCVTHMDKNSKPSDAAWRDRIQGSKGITAAARALHGIWRPDDGDEGVLRVTGKTVRAQTVTMAFDGRTGIWTVQDAAEDATAGQGTQEPATPRSRILDAVRMRPGALARDISADVGQRHDSARQLLWKMVRDGELVRTEGLYWTPEQHAAAEALARADDRDQLPLPGTDDAPVTKPLPPTPAELHMAPAAVAERQRARERRARDAALAQATRSAPRR
jgi:hypothetical protein